MKATDWEFSNRAIIFGMVLGLGFAAYSFDHESVTALLANRLGSRAKLDPDVLARLLFLLAALVLAAAALIRTWASSYLQATVVYAPQIKTESLVADGPYRRVRNPLYYANVLMALAMGSMMSRTGLALTTIAMIVFCYRLIFREEAELQSSQGDRYRIYCQAVPRLLPSFTARTANSGAIANWAKGFKAEGWYWGFAIGLAAFAITLKLSLFFGATAASIALFWVSSTLLSRN